MAHFKTLFILSLLFAVVLLISSKASAAGNEPAGVAQTQVDAEVGDWHEGGGGGWRGGGGGWRGGGGGWHGGGRGGGWHGGGGGWHGGGGWRGGGWRGGGGGCHYPYCKNVAGGDAQTEAKSGDGHIP